MDIGKGFKIGMLNIRSLWPNIDEFRAQLGFFDIMGVCETWRNPSITTEMVNLYKHKLIRQDRNTGKRGGGLAIYLSDKLYDCTCVVSEYSTVTPDLEQLWISIHEVNVRKKIIGVVYRPPGGNAEKCLESLRNVLEKIQLDTNCETTIMGDLNINHKNRNCLPFRLLKEIERDFGLKQLINQATRITRNSSTLIDIMLTDCNQVSNSGILDIYISDHLPIYYVRKKGRERNPKKVIGGRSYKHYVKEDYQHDIINDVRCRDFWDLHTDVDALWSLIHEIIDEHANYHCPMVDMYVNENCPYWFSRDLIEKINYKNVLYRKAKQTGTDEDWNNFKYQRNVRKSLIFRAKDSYIKEQFDVNLNDSKKLWRNVSSLTGLGKNRLKEGLTEIEGDDGSPLKDQDAGDFLNDYYISAGPKINQEFHEIWNENSFKIPISTTFEFEFITENQVKKLIKKSHKVSSIGGSKY